MGLEEILSEMKEKGIGGAVVREDGTIVHSTIVLNELSAGILSSISNLSDAIMKKSGDRQKEVEIAFEGLILIMVPAKKHVFCGMIKSRENKADVLGYAEKAKAFL